MKMPPVFFFPLFLFSPFCALVPFATFTLPARPFFHWLDNERRLLSSAFLFSCFGVCLLSWQRLRVFLRGGQALAGGAGFCMRRQCFENRLFAWRAFWVMVSVGWGRPMGVDGCWGWWLMSDERKWWEWCGMMWKCGRVTDYAWLPSQHGPCKATTISKLNLENQN